MATAPADFFVVKCVGRRGQIPIEFFFRRWPIYFYVSHFLSLKMITFGCGFIEKEEQVVLPSAFYPHDQFPTEMAQVDVIV